MESNTWEGRENLKNAQEAIEEFEKEYQRDMEDVVLKRAKGTISLAQARDVVPGPNCMLKSLWG